MLKLDWEKEVRDSKARVEAEKAEQREIKKARIAELDMKLENLLNEVINYDEMLRELQVLRLEAFAKLTDVSDEWGRLMQEVYP
jgi:hypothetical protein